MRVTHEEEILEPPLTWSRSAASSFDFNEAYFYQYLDDNFYLLNLVLKTIDERQQKNAQDRTVMLCWHVEFEHQQRNLKHDVYYVYEHHGWPYALADWRPNGPLILINSSLSFPFSPSLYSPR